MTYYAKSSQPDGAQETVRQHLQCVEILAQTYGRTFGAEIPAGLCGLFHDFGKYSAAFQKVLQGTQAGVDHAIGGAAFLYGFQKEYQKKPCAPSSKRLPPIIPTLSAGRI